MNTPHPWSPYIIGYCQFPDESGPEIFVQHPADGRILGYFYTHAEAEKFIEELGD